MITSKAVFLRHLQAGRIARQIKQKVRQAIQVAGFLNDHSVYALIEQLYEAYGCKTLFPTNICGPGTLVHDTKMQKPRIYSKGHCKVDLGFLHDGVMIDTAFTIVLGEPGYTSEYLERYRAVIQEVESQLYVGQPVSEIGRLVEKGMSEANFIVIPWLACHTIGERLHDEPSIMNVASSESGLLVEGQVFTLEPFVHWEPAKVQQLPGLIVTTEEGTYRLKAEVLKWHFLHPVYVLKREKFGIEDTYVDRRQEEHTYAIWQNRVHRLT